MKAVFLALLAIWLSPRAEANFGAHLAPHFGFGNMGDDSSGRLRSRSVGTFDLQAMPGYRVYGNAILVGMMFDYRFISQLSEEDNLQGLSGRGYLIGPGVGFELTFGKVLLSYDFMARYRAPSPEARLEGSGFHFIFGYRIAPNVYADLQYVRTRYNKLNDEDLGDQSIKQNNIGFGLSLGF